MHPLKKAQRWLLKRGFSQFKPAADYMAELADLPEGARRGIYVHAMQDGTQFYAGLSVDVVDRYKQHLQTYGTIEHSAFLAVPEGPLEPIESDVIDDLRRIKVTLLNVLVPSQLERSEEDEYEDEANDDSWEPDDFDSEEWEQSIVLIDETPPVPYDSKELPKFERRYRDFRASRGYSEEIMQFVRYFVRSVVPDPVRSQKDYWSINCMTDPYRKESETTLVRVTVHRPEVMAIHLNKDPNAKSPYYFAFTMGMLGGAGMDDLQRMMEVPGSRFTHDPFASARFKHIQMSVDSLEDAWAVLRNPACHRMLRQAAWALMKQGKLMPRFAQAHCLPLADEVFRGEVTLPARMEAPTLEQVLANPTMDSVWMGDSDYSELMLALLGRSAGGDAAAASALVRHADRFHYRSSDSLHHYSFEFMDRTFDLAPAHPKLWETMERLSHSKGPQYSAVAAYLTCALRPVSESAPLETVERLISGFQGAEAAKKASPEDLYANERHRHEGTILAGIVHTGDRRILPMAEAAWGGLDLSARYMFFRVFPKVASYVYVEFALNRLSECDEDPDLARAIISNLKGLPMTLDEIRLGELEFRYGAATPDDCPVQGVAGQTFKSYAESSADAIESLSDDEDIRVLIQHMLDEWQRWDDED